MSDSASFLLRVQSRPRDPQNPILAAVNRSHSNYPASGSGPPANLALRLLALLACLLCTPVCLADASQTMRFQRYTVSDGLSQSNVQAVVQDNSGLLWIATENGLDRFDGYDFHHYRRDRHSQTALENDFIADLAVDDDGNVWAATDGGGVARWNAALNNFTNFRHQPFDAMTIGDDHVRAIAFAAGTVWIGTRNSGLDLMRLASGIIEHYRHDPADPQSLSSDEVYDIAIAPDGTAWVATHSGLSQVDPQTGQVQRYTADENDPNSLSNNIVESVFVDRNGIVWAGTLDSGLYRLDPESGTFTRFQHDPAVPTSLSHDRVQAIYEDSEGRLWIGTGHGLNLMHADGTFTHQFHDAADPSSLSGDNIVSLFQDNNGILWVGTKISGLNGWNPRSWSFGHQVAQADVPGALNSPLISSFTVDTDGQIWIGTFGGGVNIWDSVGNTYRYLKNEPGRLSDNRVMALLAASDGTIWIGTMGGGLNRYHPVQDTFEVFQHDQNDPASIAADGIMSLFEDSVGRIWVGTFGGGVSRYEPQNGTFTNFRPDSANPYSLSGDRATAIIEDKYGIVWVGTDGGGLNALDSSSGKWQHFRHDPDDAASLSDNTIYTLHVDRYGRLWIGTRAGLDRLQRDSVSGAPQGFTSITQLDGLANDTIYGVRSDHAGNIWVSTNYGLSRYDPRSDTIRNFHVNHGLQGEEFNFGAHFADANGRLYFGGTNGFNAFDPARLELHNAAPQVVLTSFLKHNSLVPTDVPYERLSTIELSHADSVVTFEFTATDFVSPEQNRYQYMLDGFNKEWIDSGRERRITFTNLDDGRYLLKVRAANSDGTWTGEPFVMAVSVTPPPWRTWWAYVLYALAALFLLYLMVRRQRLKLQQEAEYSRRLEAEVQQRTQELADRNADLEVANHRLHEASHTDALTGLRNRRYLFDEISASLRSPGTPADQPPGRRREDNFDTVFIVVDLDGFKPVNDNLGHLAGDQLLLQVRDALRNACRSSDVVIRWGGDEFLVVARDTSRDDATRLVERIRESVENCRVESDGGEVASTTCSLGFAAFPFLKDRPELFSWEQVLGVADAAMYIAKRRRNGYCGIYGVEWNDNAERLLSEIKRDPRGLAELGVINITDSSSLEDQWVA